MTWLKSLSWTWKLAILAITLILVVVAYNFVDDLFSKEAETRAELSENQSEAAIESGRDAVNTVGDQQTVEIIRERTIREIQNEVNSSNDVGTAHSVGSNGLCINFGICSEDELLPTNP